MTASNPTFFLSLLILIFNGRSGSWKSQIICSDIKQVVIFMYDILYSTLHSKTAFFPVTPRKFSGHSDIMV